MKLLSSNKKWEELPDGSLRFKTRKNDVEVLIIPVEIKTPMSSSKVRLIWKNTETGQITFWKDSRKGFLKERHLTLRTAMDTGVSYSCNSTILLQIGITTEHDYNRSSRVRW